MDKYLVKVSSEHASDMATISTNNPSKVYFNEVTKSIWNNGKQYSSGPVSWGGGDTSYAQLSINGTTKNVSLNGHTHDFSGSFVPRGRNQDFHAGTYGATGNTWIKLCEFTIYDQITWIDFCMGYQGSEHGTLILNSTNGQLHWAKIINNLSDIAAKFVIRTYGQNSNDTHRKMRVFYQHGAGNGSVVKVMHSGSDNVSVFEVISVGNAIPDYTSELLLGEYTVTQGSYLRATGDSDGNNIKNTYLAKSYDLWETISS